MSPSRQRAFAWLLLGLFSLAHGVGEGWHYVPGNGHRIELPGGCLYVGLEPPSWAAPCEEGLARVQRPRGQADPTADEADCPICRLVAEAQWLMLGCVGTLPSLAGYVASSPSYLWHALVLRPFDARAPPGEPMVLALRMRHAA